jgi:hypothetical protein
MSVEAQNRNRHLWLMVLCCLIPLAALGAIFLLGVPASSALVFALILLCPLGHLLLMGPAGHKHGAAHSPEDLAPEMHPRLPAGSPAEGGQDAEPSS